MGSSDKWSVFCFYRWCQSNLKQPHMEYVLKINVTAPSHISNGPKWSDADDTQSAFAFPSKNVMSQSQIDEFRRNF